MQGVVYLNLDGVQVPDWDVPMAISGYMSRLPLPPSPSAVRPIVAALQAAQRPVLYVGGGCLDAASELRELVRGSFRTWLFVR